MVGRISRLSGDAADVQPVIAAGFESAVADAEGAMHLARTDVHGRLTVDAADMAEGQEFFAAQTYGTDVGDIIYLSLGRVLPPQPPARDDEALGRWQVSMTQLSPAADGDPASEHFVLIDNGD